MGVRMRDLMKVTDHPEVRAAIDAHDRALEVCEEALRAWKDADRRVDALETRLEAVVRRALDTATPEHRQEP